MIRLEVTQGEDTGRTYTGRGDSVGLGTAPDNEVQLSDPFVSRHHGRLMIEGDRLIYRDLGSTNGSAIRRAGETLELDQTRGQIELQDRDVLVLGESVLEFRLGEEDEEEEALDGTMIASRTLEDLPDSRERQLHDLDELALAYHLERLIGVAFEPEKMLDAILEAMLEAFPGATHAILLLVDKQTLSPRRQVARRRGEAERLKGDITVSMSVASRVLREGRSMLFRDVAAEFSDSRSAAAAGIASSLCAPLWTGEETIGLIQVESRAGKASFTERDLERLSVFASRAAVAIVGSELREAERKNQMLQDLSAMVTHDLKSPLTSVVGFLELLAQESLEDHMREYVDLALTSSMWLNVLVTAILDLARLEAGEMEIDRVPIDIRQEAEQALSLIEFQTRDKQIRVETVFPQHLPAVLASAEMFRRILINLVGNSVQLAPANTNLSISAALSSQGDSVVVSVQDEGPGIPEEYQARIFDKFVQATSRERRHEKVSVGLGLAFCRLAVEAHGGRIWVESEPGQGARFSFSLPVHSLPAPAG
jgi:signal transduction histidine kinase